MSNSSWVCFACRLAVRRPTQAAGDVVCAECGAACWPLGYKVEVPPKRDVDAWRQLQGAQLAKREALLAAAKVERVRSRHALEQEIRRLEAMPSNPGRARAIQLLRKRLAAE
jgi:hypothetical protein